MTLQANSNGHLRPHPQTLLLVEDEPFVRDATGTILRHAGFEVLAAEDACEATRIYEECHGQIDLLITDMILPGRTGLQLAEALHQQSPNLAVLVTSGYSNPEYEAELPGSRTFFLAKPYSRRGLLEKIDKIFGTAPLQRAATQAG